MKSKSILVNEEAYTYLEGLSRKSKGFIPLTKEQEHKRWEQLKKDPDGTRKLMDGDMCGEGWKDWSVEDMKAILEEEGLSYTEGDTVEYINL